MSTTQNLSTLKIHKLTENQYKNAVDTGNVEDYALYLTPDDDFSNSDITAMLGEKANKKNGIYYVKGDTGTAAGTWTGSNSDITSLHEGLTIAYYISVAGASTTTLNINGLGAKQVRYNNSKLTTYYPVGSVVVLTYDGTYWKTTEYNSDTKMRVYRQDSTSYNNDYPLIASRTISTGVGTVGTEGSYLASYGLISDTDANNPTVNPTTGLVKIKDLKVTNTIDGTAAKADALIGLSVTPAEINAHVSNGQTGTNRKVAVYQATDKVLGHSKLWNAPTWQAATTATNPTTEQKYQHYNLTSVPTTVDFAATPQAVSNIYAKAKSYTDDKIADLIGGASADYDTLKELEKILTDNDSTVSGINAALALKANQSDFEKHTGDKTTKLHITAAERTKWDNYNTTKAPNNHASTATTYGIGTDTKYGHLKISDGTTIGTNEVVTGVAASKTAAANLQSQITEINTALTTYATKKALADHVLDFDGHVGNTTAHITAAERTAWNAIKSDLVNGASSGYNTLKGLETKIKEVAGAASGNTSNFSNYYTKTELKGVVTGITSTSTAPLTISYMNQTATKLDSLYATHHKAIAQDAEMYLFGSIEPTSFKQTRYNSKVSVTLEGLLKTPSLKTTGVATIGGILTAESDLSVKGNTSVVGNVKIGSGVTLQYNSTDKALEFVFD